MAKNEDGDLFDTHSSLWHPWRDTPGQRHLPTIFKNTVAYSAYGSRLFPIASMEDLQQIVPAKKLMLFCKDVLNVREFPYSADLIGADGSTPYLSRQGNIAALRLETKRKSGFLVPARTWKWETDPDPEFVQNVWRIFQMFGFESTTPASLSEKVLRSTLPTPVGITRPSVWLRRDILNNHRGGRIDQFFPNGAYFKRVLELDKVKAYAYEARMVVSPFETPMIHYRPTLEQALSHLTGWWSCTLIAKKHRIPPVQLNGRPPLDNEQFQMWLWSFEIEDCIQAGYQVEVLRGYSWEKLSNFMEAWSDLLFEKHEQETDEHRRDVLKSMMVGLPGRFLRQPETYVLIPLEDAVKGVDFPLMMHWTENDDQKFSGYAVHPVYDKESTALSHIGSYIVAKMRSDLYRQMKEEEKHGFSVVSSYIDCYRVCLDQNYDDTGRAIRSGDQGLSTATAIRAGSRGRLAQDFRQIRPGISGWKVKEYQRVYLEGNRFAGEGEEGRELKAPGYSPEQRQMYWRKYYKIVSENETES